MFRSRHPLPRPDRPPNPVRILSSAELRPLTVSASSHFCLTLSLICAKIKKLSHAFSCSSALLKKEYFGNPFSINGCRTLLQFAGGVPAGPKIFARFLFPLDANSLRIRTSTKSAHNPFRIRTYKKSGGGSPMTESSCPTERAGSLVERIEWV